VNGQRLRAGDGMKIEDESKLTFSHGNKGEILLFDLA
jgi:quercetin 2,3-dioxygenase